MCRDNKEDLFVKFMIVVAKMFHPHTEDVINLAQLFENASLNDVEDNYEEEFQSFAKMKTKYSCNI